MAATAAAETFRVENTANDGDHSLRWAIQSANLTEGADEIIFDAGLAGATIVLTSTLPLILEGVTIDGAGATVDGNDAGRVFFVGAAEVEIANLDVVGGLGQGGAGAGRGGGGLGAGGGLFVSSEGDVTLRNVNFDSNSAVGGAGGDGTTDGGGGGGFGGDGGSGAGGGGGFRGDGGNGDPGDGGGGGGGFLEDGKPGQLGAGGKGGGTGSVDDEGGAGGTGSGAGQDGGTGVGGGGGGPGGGAGGDGGFTGGGGGATGTAKAGDGGDFGGGGGQATGGAAGDGGFGGGGGGASTSPGATAGLGGFGGGNGASDLGVGGNGGSGYGGAVFVRQGGTLTIVDSSFGDTTANSVIAGAGASSGQAAGQDLFVQTGVEVGIEVSDGGTQHLRGSISGEGSLRKTGTGTLRLWGANDYSGGTSLDAGSLAGNTSSLQGEIITQDGTEVVFWQGPNGTHTGVITGEGKLVKRGVGTLTLAGNYSYSGGTTVQRGWLAGTTSTLQGDFELWSGTALEFDQDTSGTFSGTIEGQGGVAKSGSGTVTLSGDNGYAGGTSVFEGTLRGDASSLPGTGPIDVAGGATLVFDQSGTGTFDGVIDGAGDVVKEGSGELVMSGDRTGTGATTVAAGRLTLTGSIRDDVVVQSGGTFGGTGSITSGDLTVNGTSGRRGTVAPGLVDNFGTLNVQNVLFDAGSRFEVNVDLDPSSPVSDSLVVNGSANIVDGSVVSVRPTWGSLTIPQPYTILEADDVVFAGTFPWELEQDFHFFDISLSLDTSGVRDRVELTVTPDLEASYESAAATPNQRAVGAMLDRQEGSAPALDPLLQALYVLPTPDMQRAYDEIGGEALTSFTTARLANSQKFTDTVTSRLGVVGGRAIGSPGTVDLVASLRGTEQGLSSWAPVQLAMASGVDSARMLQLAAAGPAVSSWPFEERRRVGLWLDGYGLLGGVDGDGNTADTEWTVPGVAGGLDAALGRSWVLGLAAGWAQLDLDVKDRSFSGQADVFQGGLYGAYVGERLYVGGLARYAHTSYDTSRRVLLESTQNLIDRSLAADYTGNDWGAYLEAGYAAWAPAGFQIEPMAAFDYTYLWRESFVESGPDDDIALAVDEETWHSALGSLGFRVHRSIGLQGAEGIRMVPEIWARYAHQFGDRDRPLDARLVGADPGTGDFRVVGASVSRDGAIVGLGWSVVREDSLALFVQYDLNWNRDLLGHALAVGALFRF